MGHWKHRTVIRPDYLKRKMDLGAEYIITNYVYDNRFFFLTLPGERSIFILPRGSSQHQDDDMLVEICGATILQITRD